MQSLTRVARSSSRFLWYYVKGQDELLISWRTPTLITSQLQSRYHLLAYAYTHDVTTTEYVSLTGVRLHSSRHNYRVGITYWRTPTLITSQLQSTYHLLAYAYTHHVTTTEKVSLTGVRLHSSRHNYRVGITYWRAPTLITSQLQSTYHLLAYAYTHHVTTTE